MSLTDLVRQTKRRLVFPINCLPAVQLVDEGVDQICRQAEVKFRASIAFAERFEPDIVFLFTDVALLAEGFGADVSLLPGRMPAVGKHLVQTRPHISLLKAPDPRKTERMSQHIKAVTLMRKALPDTVLAALVHGPFTVAGQLAGEIRLLKNIIEEPGFVEELMELTGQSVLLYAQHLVEAGADLVWVSDALPGLLGREHFRRFAVPALQRIFTALPVMNVLHICGDTSHLVAEMAATGVQGISLDSKVDLLAVEDVLPPETVLIGNIDPVTIIKEGNPALIAEQVEELLTTMEGRTNFILSSGCALPLDTPLHNITAFMASGKRSRELSPAERAYLAEIATAVADGKQGFIVSLITGALRAGLDANLLLNAGLLPGMRKAAGRFDQGSIFIPELLVMGEVAQEGLAFLADLVRKKEPQGKIVIGTVEGDIHELGKNLVSTMLQLNGFHVVDLGVDVSKEQFLAALQDHHPVLVALSALTTTGMKNMAETIRFLKEKQPHIKILVGGAPVTQDYARKIGADGYAASAAKIVAEVRRLLQ